MFTGIIEEKGRIEHIIHGAKSCSLEIEAKKIFDDLKLGDSVAVNGVCLTVTSIKPPYFTADVMPETLRRTGLGTIAKNGEVNLERAMQLGGRFGGHIVTGHIDGTGTVINKVTEDNAVLVTISADQNIMQYIVEKGSITLDGISLTVASVATDRFTVSIIPHTAKETTIINGKVGDMINIECDIIGKYVKQFNSKQGSGITMDFLRENGF
ncbi:MAG: riboflavin synthase [Clostridia bacterium]|nr:riboflavin synthase [Clostridia bacterium]